MKLAQSKGRTDVDMVLHKTIKKVTDDIENMRFNTAISALMIAVNELEKSPSLTRKQYEMLLQLVAPFAPHITEELWAALGNKKSIHISEWPVCDLSLTVDDEVTIMVQVNGKIRGSFVVPVDTSKEVIEQSAKDLENVKKWLEGKNVIKVIVVPKKLVNIVVV
jgi:leucyl-tRNA synthetase